MTGLPLHVPLPECPLCHTVEQGVTAEALRGGAMWTCRRCGQLWSARRLAAVADYAAAQPAAPAGVRSRKM